MSLLATLEARVLCVDLEDRAHLAVTELNLQARVTPATLDATDVAAVEAFVQALPNAWFDNSAHCIHCVGAVGDLPYIAPKSRRFDSDYSDPARVIADLAAAYPNKFMWGSDSPFYNYAAAISSGVLKLIRTYEREVIALKAAGEPVVRRIAATNTLNYLKLPNENILS
jgi:hypothetical protein